MIGGAGPASLAPVTTPPDGGSCRACPVRCERVVYPARCVQQGCERLYAHRDGGITWLGCVDKVFTPSRVKKMESYIGEVVSDLVDEVIGRGAIEFCKELAVRIPTYIIPDQLGMPRGDYATFKRWSDATIDALGGGLDAETSAAVEASIVEFAQYFFPVIAERRVERGTDLLSLLVDPAHGDTLTDGELVSFAILLLVAGNETTRTAISHGMWALQNHPDQQALWRSDFDTHAVNAVEEIVRWATPVVSFRRTVTQDVRIGERDFTEGEKVVMYYNSANRDERQFERPFEFDITRSPNPHFGYGGGGAHFCLGANLARREIRVMFEEIFRVLPDLHITGEPEMLQSGFIHGIKRMPCAFTPRG